jgi:hypothetical protein
MYNLDNFGFHVKFKIKLIKKVKKHKTIMLFCVNMVKEKKSKLKMRNAR